MNQIPEKMLAAYLPGNSTVDLREVAIPEPGHGQVLIRTKSSTICGSDIRAIYREHIGKGPEATRTRSLAMNQLARLSKWPRHAPLQRRRPRHHLPHQRLRCLHGLPPGLHDQLHQPSARGLWLAT